MQAPPGVPRLTIEEPLDRPAVIGKFLQVRGDPFWIKGVAYGTFAPDGAGRQLPSPERMSQDFAMMRRAGFNAIRTYTAPDGALLDLAAAHGLRVMAGVAWSQHVAFLDDRRLRAQIRHDLMAQAHALASHPAVILVALGNEIPAPVVRWLGRERVERFLRSLYDDAKAIAPDTLFTYVNYPPTDYLDLSFVDMVAFNVYLHREADLRAYLARLQNLAGHKPLLLAEAGADSIRETPDGQAALTSMQIRTACAEGACGAIAFTWTDEWWRGGHQVHDWAFGLVDAGRRPKPALHVVAGVLADLPHTQVPPRDQPKVSVIVCAYDAAGTIEACLRSLERLQYPDVEIIVVNDGSRDATGAIARRHARVRVIDISNGGLSAARNVGLEAAAGEIVAYTDADAEVDPYWLLYLTQPFARPEIAAAGGPNVIPPHDPWVAQCVARAPGGPTHVLRDDRTAEHVPGCNMAFRRQALLEIGGFNPIYVRAGDDVDVCWRMEARGWTIGFAPAALVWHHHRANVRAYWRQQVGYGEGEAWLAPRHPDKFSDGRIRWQGHIYSPFPFVAALSRPRINSGVWGSASFPSIYHKHAYPFAFLPHQVRWQAGAVASMLLGLATAGVTGSGWALLAVVAGTVGLLITLVRCVHYALASDIETLPTIGRCSRPVSRVLYRTLIVWLHFIQPFARAAGRLRGTLSPPRTVPPDGQEGTRAPFPGFSDFVLAVRVLVSRGVEWQYWSERPVSVEKLLTSLTQRLRGTPRTRNLEIDDGWQADRDVRIAVGPFAWLDLGMLVEQHDAGRCLVRIRQRLRPAPLSVVAALTASACGVAVVRGGEVIPWQAAGPAGVVVALALGARALWSAGRTLATVRQLLTAFATRVDLQPLRAPAVWRVDRTMVVRAREPAPYAAGPASPEQLPAPSVLRAVIASKVTASPVGPASIPVRRRAPLKAILDRNDHQRTYSTRGRPREP